jgi:hypothetical protein
MKCIAGVFLLAATGMAQALLAPAESRDAISSSTVAARPAYRPMTRSERWEQYRHDNFTGAGAYFRSLNTAALGEAWGRPSAWPSNTRGFGQRFASSFGRNAVQGSITDGMAAAFGHDTRYLPCACMGTGARVRYALQMTVMTRNQDGRKVFDVSRFAGMYGGALAMSTWRPHHLNAAADSARLTGIGVSTAIMTNLAREFAPELRRKLRRHH